MIEAILKEAIEEWRELGPKLIALGPQLEKLADAMLQCWSGGGKVLIAGNGGSAADAMHFAEELVARFQKNRRALAAIALCDPTVITCAANDFGYDSVFARQVEALGRKGDVFIAMSTSGRSVNLIKAIARAREQGVVTAAFLGRDGGEARGMSDIEILVGASTSHRVQEAHKLLFHVICQWVDDRVQEG
jgi:phosphoheptose isomerase